jgi:polar amino acid transport system substrate-binding protein
MLNTGISLMVKRFLWSFLFVFINYSSFANECKVINAACSSTWYPVSFLLPDNQNKATGVAVEIARAAAKALQVDITFNCQLPWKRANRYMNTGKIDMLVGHYLNKEREQNWVVSDALFIDDIRAVYLNKNFEINNIEALKNLVGVKPRGASFGTFLDEYTSGNISGYNVHEVTDMQAMLAQLLSGRVDYILSDRKNIQRYLDIFGLMDKFTFSDSLTLNSVHFSFSKHSPCAQYSAQFNTLINSYKVSGLVNTLFEQAKNDFPKDQETFFMIKK